MQLATKEQGAEYMRRARAWFDEYGKVMFNDAGTTARYAVAEYMAGLDGLTIYKVNAQPEDALGIEYLQIPTCLECHQQLAAMHKMDCGKRHLHVPHVLDGDCVE